MMVPEISHSFGEDEDHEVDAGGLFEPQIILNGDGDQEDEEEDYGDVEEVGVRLLSLHNASLFHFFLSYYVLSKDEQYAAVLCYYENV